MQRPTRSAELVPDAADRPLNEGLDSGLRFRIRLRGWRCTRRHGKQCNYRSHRDSLLHGHDLPPFTRLPGIASPTCKGWWQRSISSGSKPEPLAAAARQQTPTLQQTLLDRPEHQEFDQDAHEQDEQDRGHHDGHIGE